MSKSGGTKMSGASHESAYRSAINEAMDQLGVIKEEGMSVRNRMEQLQLVLEALKPFLGVAEDRRPISRSIESPVEPVPAPQVVEISVPKATDPIQRRINSVLGLAVA
jgi:hypothetical protein